MTTTNQYEAMFLLGPLATAEPDAAMKLCQGIIERHAGKILLIKKWDERKLAYELNGHKRGTYIISFFTAPGGAITGIERDAKLNEDILRILVLKADHLNETEMAAVEPQPIIPREEKPQFDRSWNERPSYDNDSRGPRGPRSRRDEPMVDALKD